MLHMNGTYSLSASTIKYGVSVLLQGGKRGPDTGDFPLEGVGEPRNRRPPPNPFSQGLPPSRYGPATLKGPSQVRVPFNVRSARHGGRGGARAA